MHEGKGGAGEDSSEGGMMTKVRFIPEAQMLTGNGVGKPQRPTLLELAKTRIQAMIQQAKLQDDQETLAFLRIVRKALAKITGGGG